MTRVLLLLVKSKRYREREKNVGYYITDSHLEVGGREVLGAVAVADFLQHLHQTLRVVQVVDDRAERVHHGGGMPEQLAVVGQLVARHVGEPREQALVLGVQVEEPGRELMGESGQEPRIQVLNNIQYQI